MVLYKCEPKAPNAFHYLRTKFQPFDIVHDKLIWTYSVIELGYIYQFVNFFHFVLQYELWTSVHLFWKYAQLHMDWNEMFEFSKLRTQFKYCGWIIFLMLRSVIYDIVVLWFFR